jgi:transmembrane sensor
MNDAERPIPENARDTAIDWWLRRNERPLSREEQKQFAAWLAADAANKAAFAKVSKLCGFLETELPGAGPVRKTKRLRRRVAAAVVTAVAILALGGEILPLVQSDYSTGTGQTKRVTLDDGSRVELDAKSSISVRFDAIERRLTLLEGQAWFEVAPDPRRPFVVEAAGGTVRALGTAFDVALENKRAEVTVGEHRVAVSSGGRSVEVEEGRRSVYFENQTAQRPEPIDVEKATAWRRGRLIFNDKPLDEVIEALGRYHRGYVVFLDPALRKRRVTGVFLTYEPLAALDEIETSLGLHALRLSDYLILIHK